MSKKLNKRVGVGMKPLANQAAEALPEKDASVNEVQQEAAKDAGLAAEDHPETIGRLEAENATKSGLEKTSRMETDEYTAEDALAELRSLAGEDDGEDEAKEPPAPADASVQNLDPQSCKLTFTGRLEDLLEVDLSKHGKIQFVPSVSGLGEQPDGTFNLVLNIPEGLIEPIREQAASDGVTPEEWCRIRFVEMMDSWWEGPKGR